ncbi:MAG: phosphoribosylformylglycinamidine synthase subunit PurS [Elusimicrobiota bacterium]|jgi:phosphoribosylformylglycinamidine synthase|nr:phosphoribosylformylglycinamidine synthase subunit PurS [Elusimicrobiota bacterium]
MYKIEIKTKKMFKNSNAASILEEVKGLSITGVKRVDYSPLYFIDANLTFDEVKKIASELLADQITQEWIITKEKTDTKENVEKKSQGQSFIEVYYKKGVMDAPAESVVKAVKDLGIAKEIKVKTGHRYCFWGDISNEVLEMIAKKILSNNIIQGYKIN